MGVEEGLSSDDSAPQPPTEQGKPYPSPRCLHAPYRVGGGKALPSS